MQGSIQRFSCPSPKEEQMALTSQNKRSIQAVLILCFVLSNAVWATFATSQERNQQARTEKLRGVLKSLADAVSGMDGLIKLIGTAHGILHDDMTEAMTQDLA